MFLECGDDRERNGGRLVYGEEAPHVARLTDLTRLRIHRDILYSRCLRWNSDEESYTCAILVLISF
jgi:hypothetical protein